MTEIPPDSPEPEKISPLTLLRGRVDALKMQFAEEWGHKDWRTPKEELQKYLEGAALVGGAVVLSILLNSADFPEPIDTLMRVTTAGVGFSGLALQVSTGIKAYAVELRANLNQSKTHSQ